MKNSITSPFGRIDPELLNDTLVVEENDNRNNELAAQDRAEAEADEPDDHYTDHINSEVNAINAK